MPRIEEREDKKHLHEWVLGMDYSTYRCGNGQCQKIAMSQPEYDRRSKEWDNYYELVKTTDSYSKFVEMKEAFFSHNLSRVKEIAADSKERLDKNEYLEAPNFKDPRDYSPEII